MLKKELEEGGLFQVEVVTAPALGGDFSAFKPDFGKYQVIVMNYDAPDERWPESLKAAFKSYIRGGGGRVTGHAADNAFAGCEMIGIGGWRGRTEESGPLWYFKDGKLVSDDKPGRAGNHGNRVPFAITVQNPNHPITKGLPYVWMHQDDELYNSMRGPGQNIDEPILLTLSHGKGRVFHTALGHDISALSCVGFRVTFRRVTEWAVTGKVAQKIPPGFPTALWLHTAAILPRWI